MRSTFWPNRIFGRQSCQNRHTGLKSSSKREKSALFMKIVQNACFRSCAGGFAQIVFVRVKLLEIARLVSNSLQNGKTVRFSWKLYKTLVSGHAQHVLAKSHFWASKLSKSSHWPEILFKTRKQCAFHENCTKRAFQVMRSTFWPNRIFERQSCQNRHTALKFSPKRGKGARFMKIVQNARFRSCAARFGQIAFLSAAHDLKSPFCTIFMESALFPRFEENFRPVWRFWQLWRSKMRFGQNVLRMTWNERFVQFSWNAHPFHVLERIWGQCDDFDNFDAQKCDLAKTCCAWPETIVLYNFHEKRTVSPFWREFVASVTILTTLTLKNAIWPKRAAYDLKRAFCTMFMKSSLFPRFGEILRPVWRFWQIWL